MISPATGKALFALVRKHVVKQTPIMQEQVRRFCRLCDVFEKYSNDSVSKLDEYLKEQKLVENL